MKLYPAYPVAQVQSERTGKVYFAKGTVGVRPPSGTITVRTDAAGRADHVVFLDAAGKCLAAYGNAQVGACAYAVPLI